ncbi:MAG: geranylgeranylglycerol-phosphate geranylgeranyltransferase [Candidatus Zixiibacteriota bacterium]
MFKLLETLKLIRAVNCLIAMAGVWVGAYMTWLRPVYYAPAAAGLAAFLICAAGNIINDLLDIEIDRVSHPGRVLVKGTVSTRYALILSICFNVVAIGLALTVSLPLTGLAVIVICLLYLYNYRLKKIPLAGNVVISLLAGLTFLTGGFAVDYRMALYLPGPLIAAVFAFFMNLVREIIKDVHDVEGDRALGVKTLPQVIGEQKAIMVALSLFFALVLLTLAPILSGWFGKWYKIITVYIVDLPILGFLIFLWGDPNRRMLAIGAALIKVGMALGVLALVLA